MLLIRPVRGLVRARQIRVLFVGARSRRTVRLHAARVGVWLRQVTRCVSEEPRVCEHRAYRGLCARSVCCRSARTLAASRKTLWRLSLASARLHRDRGLAVGRVRQVFSAVLAVALLGSAASAGTGRDLSTQERASLDAGALVSRPQAERRGSLDLIGGTSYQVIDAPVRVVWRALLDTQYYPRMMPQVLEARVVAAEAAERTVFMRQGAGPLERAYYLSVRMNEAQGDITFRVDDRRPHDLRAAWGFYNVRPYADGTKTLLAYGVMADFNVGVLGSWFRDDVHEWMLKVPWTVKRFVEGSGRHIYKHTWRDSVARFDGLVPATN